MDEKNCVANFYVELSPEATAKLPLSSTQLRALVRTYRYFPYGKALKVLFCFNYGTQAQKKEAISWFKRQKHYIEYDIVSEDNLDEIFLYNEEEFRILTNELRIQYQAAHPAFLDINTIKGIPNDCQEELSTLKKKMAEHPVLLFKTVEHCVLAHKKDTTVARCVLQLLSNNTADDTIALESLGFNFQYRIHLLPFAKEIGMLLFAMHQSYLNKQKLLTIQDTFAIPLIELLEQMQDTSEENFNEISFFETEVLKFIEISSNVTSNDVRFNTFIEYRKKLEHLGKAIISLAYAKLALNEIQFELTQSNTEFSGQKNDGILLAAATNFPLTKKMFEAEKSYNEAMAKYCSASKDLCIFINMFNKTP